MTLPSNHWALGPLAVLDVETTGLDPAQGDRIIEVGVVAFDRGAVSERWGSLVDPEMPLSSEITELTRITAEDVAAAPRFAAVAGELLRRLDGRLLVAYNASFDRGFLLHELDRVGAALPPGAQWFDPLVAAKELQKGQGNMKLGTVAKRLDVALEEAHRAVADAECAGWILQALAPQLPQDLEEALDLHETWEAAQNASRGAWRNRRRDGSLGAASDSGPSDALGPGYPHGDELDPVRYMFLRGTGRA